MSLCQSCQHRVERPCTYEPRTKEIYNALIPALRMMAERCGYAITVHGSLKTDIDLVACPWRNHPIDAHSLAAKVAEVIKVIVGVARVDLDKPVKKPCGRLAWAIHTTPEGMDHYGPYIDLSVMPAIKEEKEKQ